MTPADFAARVAELRCTSEVDGNGTIWLYAPPGHRFALMDVHSLSMDSAAARPPRRISTARAALALDAANGIEICPDAACDCHESDL